MIASFQYIVRGNEGANMKIQGSSAKIIDIIVEGASYRADELMNEATGVLTLPFTLPKGSAIRFIYKKLPRYRLPISEPPVVEVREFSNEFSSEFA